MSSKEESRKVSNKTPEKSPRRPKQGGFFVIVNETFVWLAESEYSTRIRSLDNEKYIRKCA